MKGYKIILLFILPLFFACSEKQKRKEGETSIANSLEEEAGAPINQHINKAYYPIPSPEQMFGFINDNGVLYSKELMNNPSNIESYINPSKRALNFGVYTADLAYSAAYQDIESTISFYRVVKKLGAEMNISEIMSEETMKKIQENMQNPDSLSSIAGVSYYQAVEFLEQNGQEGKLALMSLGGWIESLYITLNALGEFDATSKTIQRLADQKVTFGNLYTYLKKYENKAGVKEEIDQIKGIRAVFASLLEEKKGKTKSSRKEGRLVLGGGTKVIISKIQFEALKAAINSYRSNIISTTH